MIYLNPSDYLAQPDITYLDWARRTTEPFTSLRPLRPKAAARVWDQMAYHSPGSRHLADWQRHLDSVYFIEEVPGDDPAGFAFILLTHFFHSHEELFLLFQPDRVFSLPRTIFLHHWPHLGWAEGYFILTRDEKVLLAYENGLFMKGVIRHPYEIGALYATPNQDGTFSVVKILNLDRHGVHLALYANKFPQFPADFQDTDLYLDDLTSSSPIVSSAHHIPLSRSTFLAWHPVFLRPSYLTDEDLVGYRLWLNEEGGTSNSFAFARIQT